MREKIFRKKYFRRFLLISSESTLELWPDFINNIFTILSIFMSIMHKLLLFCSIVNYIIRDYIIVIYQYTFIDIDNVTFIFTIYFG